MRTEHSENEPDQDSVDGGDRCPCYTYEMAQTPEGARRTAAKHAGISFAEYLDLESAGQKRCTACKTWHDLSAFALDRTRHDGLTAQCRESRNGRARRAYVPQPRRVFRGRSFVPARDGDRKQAERRINYFVEAGLIPPPNSQPCIDCGHVWKRGGKRHEYDHYLGYAPQNHEQVQPVCSTCHHRREIERRHV